MKCCQAFLLICPILFIHVESNNDVNKANLHNEKLPPCQSCKLLVNSFNHGLERTSRGKYEGGDSAWEEKKMKSYTASEVRLIEIQEKLCNEVERGKFQCQGLAEENEAHFEEWWKNQGTFGDLYTWLCIEKLQMCCHDLHYGKNCTPCIGFPDNVCSNNGKCKGSGTRKGNGKCSCNTGYEGLNCNKCSDNHYEAYKDGKKILCSPCHPSCQKSCTQGGRKGCHACKAGWVMTDEYGCSDVNECIKETACRSDQFCVNNEGSYTCLECDPACKTCDGDGPDMCKECADGFVWNKKVCMDGQRISRKAKLDISRYMTYFGLCVATCIILQKNTIAAGLIGLVVTIYITLSEYTIARGKLNSDLNYNLSNLFGIFY